MSNYEYCRVPEIAAMPPGPKRNQRIKRAVDMLGYRIDMYRQLFNWPALFKSLEQERQDLLALRTPECPHATVGNQE